MYPIPAKLRAEIKLDPFMKTCIHNNKECSGRITWEHAWIYNGKQIQEAWAIVPVCYYHHLGDGLDKRFNEYIALRRANIADLMVRMPRTDWLQKFKYLSGKYKHLNIKINPITYKPMESYNSLSQLARTEIKKLRSKASQKQREADNLEKKADELQEQLDDK